jgi:prophage DNA circulation protein
MSWLALGAQLGGSLLQHSLNQRSQKKAFEQNVQFWQNKFDQTNAYNHPVQQMARMKQAGLNPALMYGQSATGATGTAQSQSSEGAKAAQMSGGMNQLGLVSAQAEQIKAQTDLAKQDRALRAIQATTELSKSAKTEAEAKTASNLAKTSLDLFESQMIQEQNKAIQSFMQTEIMNKSKQDQVNAIMSDARLKAANAVNVQNQNEIYEETRKALIKAGVDPKLVLNLIQILK